MSADFETLEEAQAAERQIETMEFPALPSRGIRQQNKLLARKVLKLHNKGNTPRQIAHKLGYMNIDKAEGGIRQFISLVNKNK